MRTRRLALAGLIVWNAIALVHAPRSAAQSSSQTPDAAQLADGSIVSVDVTAKTFVLHGKHGDRRFAWDDATTVVGRKGPAYLKAGSSVTVQYTTSRDTWKAVKIAVHPAKHGTEQG